MLSVSYIVLSIILTFYQVFHVSNGQYYLFCHIDADYLSFYNLSCVFYLLLFSYLINYTIGDNIHQLYKLQSLHYSYNKHIAHCMFVCADSGMLGIYICICNCIFRCMYGCLYNYLSICS